MRERHGMNRGSDILCTSSAQRGTGLTLLNPAVTEVDRWPSHLRLSNTCWGFSVVEGPY